MSMKPTVADERRARVPKAMLGALLVLVVIAFTTSLGGCGMEGTTTTRPDSTTGTAVPSTVSEDVAPDFTGVTLDGADVSLSEYRGRPLVLAFMASW